MRLTNISEIHKFIAIIDECEGEVWLESFDGNKINLKSKLSQYVAVSALISAEGDNLELYCSNREDEAKFLKFFHENPALL